MAQVTTGKKSRRSNGYLRKVSDSPLSFGTTVEWEETPCWINVIEWMEANPPGWDDRVMELHNVTRINRSIRALPVRIFDDFSIMLASMSDHGTDRIYGCSGRGDFWNSKVFWLSDVVPFESGILANLECPAAWAERVGDIISGAVELEEDPEVAWREDAPGEIVMDGLTRSGEDYPLRLMFPEYQGVIEAEEDIDSYLEFMRGTVTPFSENRVATLLWYRYA